jgi:hypothetical protein
MDHPKCATCMHWQVVWAYRENLRPAEFGVCGFAVMTQIATTACEPDYEPRLNEAHKDKLMLVMDGEDYHAELQTHPDFYCPHHSGLVSSKGGE